MKVFVKKFIDQELSSQAENIILNGSSKKKRFWKTILENDFLQKLSREFRIDFIAIKCIEKLACVT